MKAKSFLIVLSLLLLPSAGFSKTVRVPGDYSKIQQAIDALSSPGDVVLVDPGTYVENIDFKGKAITVKSALGPEYTRIDGSQAGSVVRFETYEGPDSVLDGFFIFNGYAQNGGGIYCFFSSPKIVNNDIRWCESNYNGAGIYCHAGAPQINFNTIQSNNAGYHGSGLCCVDKASPEISHNFFYLNQASSYGGGIYSDGSSPRIHHNTFQENFTKTAHGGAISVWLSSPVIENNLIHGNTAHITGGGMSIEKSDAIITNNTLTENSAGIGGGIYTYQSNPVITNTIFWNNSAATGSELAIGKNTVIIRYSTIKGGSTSIHVYPNTNLVWGPGMIKADPLFVDPVLRDFHLTWRSPCINMGTNDGAPPEDLDGDVRPVQGTADMGADEFTGIHPLEADRFSLSEATGGTVNFSLHGDAGNQGRDYLILGSVTGTVPGNYLPGGSTILPLNWDLFTNLIIEYLNSVYFQNFMGTLDQAGSGGAAFNTLGPLPTGTAGLVTMSFAYALRGPVWDFVSNPIHVEIVP